MRLNPRSTPRAARLSIARAIVLCGSLCLTVVSAAAGEFPELAVPSQGRGIQGAHEALQTGRYEEAENTYRALARQGRGLPASGRGWVRSLAERGAYEEALEAISELVRRHADSRLELARVRGQVLMALGLYQEAENSLREAIQARTSDAQLARLDLALLLVDRGKWAEAEPLFQGFIRFYNTSSNLDAEHLRAVGQALGKLGVRNPALFHDAVRTFEEAIAVDPGDPEPKIDLALLFLDKYNSLEAGPLLEEVLARNPSHPRALLARALRARFEGSMEAMEFVRRSLEANPNSVPALSFLARLHAEMEEVSEAEAHARRALEVNPSSLLAWTELAAAAHLRSDSVGFREAVDQVLELDPNHAPLFVALAEVSYRTARYHDAVDFARRAVELDPFSWRGYAELGLNQLRTGSLAEGRATIEAAFEGDPFNIWLFNTLDLLDELAGFESVNSPRFVFRFHPRERDVLAPYATAIAEEAFEVLRERYGFEPPTPISVEVYDRHADFSVRTTGLAGLGALGVSFGSVLAMDSPSARPSGGFSWGATLWHEISHAFTLGYTQHRLPRWFSEGLAVLDERRGRPGWGADPDLGFLRAFNEGRLPALERFNSGFVRPAYPGQVQHSYFKASLLCEMLEETRGATALRGLLGAYRDGLDTPTAFRQVLGGSLEEIGSELDRWIESRYSAVLSGLSGGEDGFVALMTVAAEARNSGNAAEAITALERAHEIFPEYAGPDAPSLLLGHLYQEAGDSVRAAAALRTYTAVAESNLDAHVALADFEEALGRPAAALDVMKRTLWIDPMSRDLHERLAEAFEVGGQWEEAAREWGVILALEPPNVAETHYRRARALFRNGDAAGARSSVLDALEIAPNFDAALELLLEIRGSPR